MVLAARIREELGLPGMTVEQTLPFRDKELMKQVLDAAGIRTPRHASTLDRRRSLGGGRADRLPADHQADRRRGLGRHLPGRLAGRAGRRAADDRPRRGGQRRGVHRGRGVHLRHRLRGRERPVREHQLVPAAAPAGAQPRVDQPDDRRAARHRQRLAGRRRGRWGATCCRRLGFNAGFTHMEWYRKADGEVVFGEIGARPPGARTVDVMNYATDGDLFRMWAEAVVTGTSAP